MPNYTAHWQNKIESLFPDIFGNKYFRLFDTLFIFFYILLSTWCFLAYVKTDAGVWSDFRMFWRATHLVIWSLVLLRPKPIFEIMLRSRACLSLMLFLIVSVFWSMDKAETLDKSLSLVTNFLFGVYFVSRFNEKRRFEFFESTLIAVLSLSLVVVFFFPEVGVMQDDVYKGCWQGIIAHKNHFGRLMAFASALFLVGVATGRRVTLYSFCALAAAACVLFSRSATGLLGLILLTAALWILFGFKKPSGQKRARVLILVIYFSSIFHVTLIKNPKLADDVRKTFGELAGLPGKQAQKKDLVPEIDMEPVSGIYQPVVIKENISAMDGLVVSYSRDNKEAKKAARRIRDVSAEEKYTDKALFLIGREKTLSGRTLFWPLLVGKIFEKPWLGYGYYGFWSDKNPAFHDVIKNIQWKILMHAHNSFIDIVLDVGFAGLAVFCVLFFLVAKRSWAYFRRGNEPWNYFPLLFLIFYFTTNHTESGGLWVNYFFWPTLVIVNYWVIQFDSDKASC